jgi:hypothetical protein
VAGWETGSDEGDRGSPPTSDCYAEERGRVQLQLAWPAGRWCWPDFNREACWPSCSTGRFTLGTVTDDGTIYAGSKQSGPPQNQRQFANCSYFDENGQFLGYFPSDKFASTDPDAVREFCVANFEN